MACRVEDEDLDKKLHPTTDPQKRFADEFTQLYGTVSPDITWMTVSCDVVQVDMSQLPSSASYTLRFYTADPLADTDYCYVLAEYKSVTGGSTESFEVDYPSGLNNVFVSAESEDGTSYVGRVDMRESPAAVLLDAAAATGKLREQKPMSYMIGYEGFTGDEDGLDFDYNDVVLELEYVRGRETAKVYTVAAGCECAAQVAYHRSGAYDSGDDEVLFDEVHESLGFGGYYNYMERRLVYDVLNVGINQLTKKGEAVLELKKDVDAQVSRVAQNLYVYFTIVAQKEKDNTTTVAFIPGLKGVQYPQAILVADPTWRWSIEGMLLSATYSQFRPWIYGPEGNELWYGAKNWKDANKNFE